ncbi:MAG: FGGY-family carbohydrate kinase [Actinomycetota bacterium]
MGAPGVSEKGSLCLALDVGSHGLRAGLFDSQGGMRAAASREIEVFSPAGDHYEQSSTEIWAKALEACDEVLEGAERRKVRGISCDATCSLVVRGRDGRPLPVSPGAEPERDIIMWMDHRAAAEAADITSTRGEPVRYLGGTVSPEHELPKLLWLKRHMRATYDGMGEVYDLADYLTHMASGSRVRSNCTMVCKWGYLAHRSDAGWDRGFFAAAGLEDLYEKHLSRYEIGRVGEAAGRVSPGLAAELGLSPDCVVAVPLIDAHSGGVGSAGTALAPGETEDRVEALTRTLVVIMGTSNCHMATSREPVFIPGVWGPYYGAMVPGMWLNEGGQNATGSLLDLLLRERKVHDELTAEGETIFDVLERKVADLRVSDPEFNRYLNVLPYFYGNRSPRADPDLWGTIDGLRLEDPLVSYAKLYLSTVQALAFGTRHIVEEMEGHGYRIENIVATGGHTKNELLLQEHANILGRPIYLGGETENMLLGGAINAAAAAGEYPSLIEAMAAMSTPGREIKPREEMRALYEKKYRVFKEMYRNQIEIRKILDG